MVKKMQCMVITSIRYATCISCIVKDKLISEISFGILYIFKRKMFHKCSSLIERKVRLFSNKQEFLPLLHLKSFRQFQNLSEEMMEPCR